LSCSDLPNHSASCCALGIFRKLSISRGAPTWSERLFGAMVWKLLIIEPFSQWKLNEIKTESCIGIWGCFWCCWKAFSEPHLIEFISQFPELRCGRYWFLNGFCCWKFKQIAKIEVGRKIFEPSMCFTLGPTAQATLSVWNHQLPHRENNFSSLQKMVYELTLSMDKWWLIIVR